MKNNILKYAAFALMLGVSSACSDSFFESNPGDIIVSDQLENVDPAAGLNGMYAYMYKFDTMNMGEDAQHYDFGFMSTMLASELWGQDMIQYSSQYGWFYNDYKFAVTSRAYQYTSVFYHWNYFYKLIKSANDVLLTTSDDTKEQRGQALGMRAFAYLYLVQMYQHTYVGHQNDPAVPIITETSTPEELAENPRATVEEVYKLIESDLTQAFSDLEGFNRPNITVIDQHVVAGFMARMYLLKEDWTNAAKYANIAKAGFTLADKSAVLEGFIDMNKQPSWMWASDITIDAEMVQTGIVNFISHISSTAYGYVTAGGMYKNISAELYDKIADNDVRKDWWCRDTTQITEGPMQPKLPPLANLKFGFYNDNGDNCNDLCYMRAEEMYLIEAEALAMGGNAAGGKALLEEFVQSRQPDYKCTASSPEDIQEAVWIQRRIELWGEGFAWFDLKRLKKPIIRKYAGTNHKSDALYDFPAEDDIFRFLIPRKEIQDNNGISDADNNKMPNIE